MKERIWVLQVHCKTFYLKGWSTLIHHIGHLCMYPSFCSFYYINVGKLVHRFKSMLVWSIVLYVWVENGVDDWSRTWYVWLLWMKNKWEIIFVQLLRWFLDNFHSHILVVFILCLFLSLYCLWPTRKKRNNVISKIIIKLLYLYKYIFIFCQNSVQISLLKQMKSHTICTLTLFGKIFYTCTN